MAPSSVPISNVAVPTLVPGRDAMPAACPHCESRALQHRAAAGGEHFGTLSCLRCGSVAAYVQAPPPPIGAARERRVPDEALPPREPRPRTIVVERAAGFERDPDCTGDCGPSTGHAPHVHREAGRSAALAELAASSAVVVRTGPLAVDVLARVAYVDGAPVALIGRGMDVLLALASAAGRAVSWRELLERVWPERAAGPLPSRGPYHLLSVVMVRLRRQLGPDAGRLVTTVPSHGYRLAMVDYTGPRQLAPPIGPLRPGPFWSRAHAACVDCGGTERPHKAHGRCTRCAGRTGRPAGRPPLARWARDWAACQICGTTEHPHHMHGHCAPCAKRTWLLTKEPDA